MKSFIKFFTEAVETLASTEAKNRGLIGDGHGDWYDRQGNLVAKTVGGKLKYFGQGQSQSDSGQDAGASGSSGATGGAAANQNPDQEQAQEAKGAVVVVGRFNPPSKNHQQLLKAGFSQAKRRGFEYRIYPSRIQDSTSNPLNPTLKISYMKSMFPEYGDYIVDSEDAKTIFDILESLYNDGYSDVTLVVGQERLGEFQSLVHKAEGQGYEFSNLEVITAGVKDPDSEVESPGSSALMKAAVAMNDFYKFEAGLPAEMDQGEKEELFSTLRKSMKVNESTEAWRIEPEFDYDGLRWNYKNNNLFEVGTFIENVNSGLVGKIIRRGANYLICVTEDNLMFKSWLKDVREVHEIGTDEYREYVQSVTPGEKVRNFLVGRNKKTVNSSKNYK